MGELRIIRPKLDSIEIYTAYQPTETERLDANVVYLRVRAWEQAERELRRRNRREMYKLAGSIAMTLAVGILWFWIQMR